MQATSLSINLPGACDASCPFCVSKLTAAKGKNDTVNIRRGLDKAFRYASYHNVDTVLITGKGEPALHDDFVNTIIMSAREKYEFPIIELQTNGYQIWKNVKKLERWVDSGLTTLAISIADFDPFVHNDIIQISNDYNYLELLQFANELGVLCRISYNMCCDFNVRKLKAGAKLIKNAGAHQLTLRELGMPNNYGQENKSKMEIINWIHDNSISNHQMQKIIDEVHDENRVLRTVSYGPSVYDYQGLSTVIATCMTDNVDPNEIRSLILQPDGHLYHSWNFEGSILL